MNILAWEIQLQRQRDMLRKAQAAGLGEIALAANRQRRRAHFLRLYHSLFGWLHKHLQTRYNDNLETARQKPSVAHADPPMR
jgi:hypothetical protein